MVDRQPSVATSRNDVAHARFPQAVTEDMLPERFPPTRAMPHLLPRTGPLRGAVSPSGLGRAAGCRAEWHGESTIGGEERSRTLLFRAPDVRDTIAAVDSFAALSTLGRREHDGDARGAQASDEVQDGAMALPLPALIPAWLNGSVNPLNQAQSEEEGDESKDWGTTASSTAHSTLHSSLTSIEARRFGTKSRQTADGTPEALPLTADEGSRSRIPLLTVFSIAGGVGKTSLVATLGRALSCLGERVLLADTTPHTLLPLHYGTTDLEPSRVRSLCFAAESGSAPLDLISLDVCRQGDTLAESWLRGELIRKSQMAHRILLDTSVLSPWAVRFLAQMNSCMLVPLVPDMNSVMTLDAVNSFFAEMEDEFGQAVQPHFVLNHFDGSQPLHLDLRELLRQRLGDRLLPVVIRRSPAVPEALAAGMTVIDYAAENAVATDFAEVAKWLKEQGGGMLRTLPDAHWSEA